MEPHRPEPGPEVVERPNSPEPGPEVVERHTVGKKRAAPRVRSWTGKNEMRGVREQVSAGAVAKILDTANFIEKRI